MLKETESSIIFLSSDIKSFIKSDFHNLNSKYFYNFFYKYMISDYKRFKKIRIKIKFL